MTTVHVFGNWKWTGPADPVLAAAQAQQAQLWLGRCPFDDLRHAVADQAAERGLSPKLLHHLQKHWNPWRVQRAAAELLPLLREVEPRVIHVHLDADHAAVWKAVQLLERRPTVVRTVHSAGPHPARRRELLRTATDLVLSPAAGLAAALETELGWPAGSTAVVEPVVDLERFHFSSDRRQRGRAHLGLQADDFAIGIVARIQRHRRFDLLLDAWEILLHNSRPPPRLVLLGRGTEEDELVHKPVQQRGLADCVLLPGYQQGDAYLDALAACDAGLFLVPGTDVACRAVREWMAMGRAVVATQRPPLPEMITSGFNGLLINEDAAALAQAIQATSPAEWSVLGAGAARTAAQRYSQQRLGPELELLAGAAERTRPEWIRTAVPAARAVLAIRPGEWPRASPWAIEQGFLVQDLALLDPYRSRDAVLDVLRLTRQSGARHVLLTAHPEWDAPFIRELRHHASVAILGGGTGGPRERWLQRLACEGADGAHQQTAGCGG